MPIAPRLQKLLDGHDLEYEILHHPVDYRAHATASHTHTPTGEFAKTVVLSIDGQFAFAVLPASHHVALSRFARAIGADDVRLASESEVTELTPGCEVGAEPPFGCLYGLRTYASPILARDERITFNGGTHRDAVRMKWSDYARVTDAQVVPLSRHEEEGPG